MTRSGAQSCSSQDICCGNNICDPGEDRSWCPEDCDRGCNFDTVCEPDHRENATNCPSDCNSVCGDSLCQTDQGEDSSNCPADCEPTCVPQGCDTRCGIQDDGCGGQIDCGQCPTCGNQLCEQGETAETCPADCGTCVPQGCGGRCGLVDDGCGTPIDCGSCGETCNNDGTCNATENANVCPNDCVPVCGNMACEAGEQGTCADCNVQCSGTSCTAGVCGNGTCEDGEDCSNCAADCAARPTFMVTPEKPIATQDAIFMADPSLILDPPTPLWDLGNTEHRSGNPLTYPYPNAGSYTVILTTREANCNTEVTVRKTVQVVPATSNQPPTARPGGPYLGRVNELVQFDGSRSSDPDGTITRYRWDFGDGVQGDGRVTPHIYSFERNYAVTLTVTDNGGLSSTAQTSADIQGGLGAPRFVTSESLTYDPFTNELRAAASLTILQPDSQTYSAKVKYVIYDLSGHRYDSGFTLFDSPISRIIQSPAAGTWYLDLEYYYADYVHPGVAPFIVSRKTVSTSVNSSPIGPRPRIDGPHELWYFNGVPAGDPTPTQLTLYVFNTNGPCTFTVEQGQGRVFELGSGSCSATFYSLSGSSFQRDVAIRVESGGQTSDLFYLTVRKPNRVTLLSFNDFGRGSGFETEYQMRLLDQFSSGASNVRIHESFGTSSNLYPTGNNWGIPNTSSDTVYFDGWFNDRYFLYFCSDCRPQPVEPFDSTSWDPVRDLEQTYEAGPVRAVFIKQHTLRWYRGRVRQLQ